MSGYATTQRCPHIAKSVSAWRTVAEFEIPFPHPNPTWNRSTNSTQHASRMWPKGA